MATQPELEENTQATETAVDEAPPERKEVPVTTGITSDDFIAARARARAAREEAARKKAESTTENTEEEEPEAEEATQATTPPKDTEKTVFDDKTLDALADRLVQRQQATQKTQPEQTLKENPLRDITDTEELDRRLTNANTVIKWGNRLIRENTHLGPDEEITTVDGKSLNRIDLLDAIEKAEDIAHNLVPDQQRYLQQEAAYKAHGENLMNQAREQLDWMADEESPQYQDYQSILQHPAITEMTKSGDPEMRAALPFLAAHAVNSINLLSNEQKQAQPKAEPKQQRQSPQEPRQEAPKKTSQRQLKADELLDEPEPRSVARGLAQGASAETTKEERAALSEFISSPDSADAWVNFRAKSRRK